MVLCAFFDSLPPSVQQQLDLNVKILVTNTHGGISLTKGVIDLTTSLTGCEMLQHQKLRFLLDPLSDVITIGMKTLKESSINIFECEKNPTIYDEQIDHVCSVLAKEDEFNKFLKDNPKAYDKDQLLQPKIFTNIRLSKDYRPKRFPILPIKPHLIDKVKEKVEEEIRRGIIRKVKDKFGGERSFAVIVDNGPNKDPRICLALLNINKYTELKPYVLPKIRDLKIFNKSNFNVVLVLDISGAFNTIGLEDDSIPLTRFGLPFGIYEHVRLPFGWKKSSEIWIEVITKLLQPVESENCSLTIYMDDHFLRSHVSYHGKLLRQIINILMNHNIQISLHKCKFIADSVPYHGFNYSISQGLSIPIDTVSGIVNLKVPSNRDELKRTLAFLNYFSSNVAGFSMMAAEFYSMLSNKDSPRSTFCWDQVTTNEFKNLLTSFAKAIALKDVPSDIINTLLYPVANLNAISVIIAVKNSTNNISIMGIHNRVLKSYEKRYSLDQKLLVASIENLQLYSPVTTMYPVDIKVD
uniref:Reverse transcriptase domain-containing protein n=1 Tax=Strongyloides papillosus TaxID=174720 RepID=A0A0N5B1U6_STREA